MRFVGQLTWLAAVVGQLIGLLATGRWLYLVAVDYRWVELDRGSEVS